MGQVFGTIGCFFAGCNSNPVNYIIDGLVPMEAIQWQWMGLRSHLCRERRWDGSGLAEGHAQPAGYSKHLAEIHAGFHTEREYSAGAPGAVWAAGDGRDLLRRCALNPLAGHTYTHPAGHSDCGQHGKRYHAEQYTHANSDPDRDEYAHVHSQPAKPGQVYV